MDGRTWPLTISQADARDKEPAYIRQLPPASIPNLRSVRSELGPALEFLATLEGVEERVAYNATGLLQLDDDRRIFLHPAGGAITEHGRDDRYQATLPADLAGKVEDVGYGFLPTDPATAAADALTLLRLLEAADVAGVPDSTRALGPALLGAIGAAPLAQALPTGAPPLLIYGTTGSLKSAWARLTLSCFGRVHGRAEPSTINAREMASKVYAIEQILHALPGVISLIDDGLKGAADPKQIAAFYQLLSLLGSHAVTRRGTDRGRNTNGRGQGGFWKTWYPRGALLGTVEELPAPAESASELARWAILRLEPGQTDVELLTLLQEQTSAEALNRATAGYVSWLVAPGRLEQVTAWVDEARGHYETLGLHMRMPDTYARLTAGFRAVLAYVADTAQLPADLAVDYGHLATEWLTAMARRQADSMGVRAGRAERLAPVPYFWSVVRHALREGRIHLSSAARDEHGLPAPPDADLLPEGAHVGMLGWQSRPDRDGIPRWETARGSVEAGILFRGRDWPYAVRIRAADWPGDVYTALERTAQHLGRPLPGATEMLELLAAEGQAQGLSRNDRCGGKFWSRKVEACRVLDLRPLLDPEPPLDDDDDQDAGATPPAAPTAPAAEATTAAPTGHPEAAPTLALQPEPPAARPPDPPAGQDAEQEQDALPDDLADVLATLHKAFPSASTPPVVVDLQDNDPSPDPPPEKSTETPAEQQQDAPQAPEPPRDEGKPVPPVGPAQEPHHASDELRRRGGQRAPRVQRGPFRTGVLGHVPDGNGLGLYRPGQPIHRPEPPRDVADLLELASREYLDQLWIAPEIMPALGLPDRATLPREQRRRLLPNHEGITEGLPHPFVDGALDRADVRPAALAPWLHGWQTDLPAGQRRTVDLAFPAYMDPASPLAGVTEAGPLLAALLKIYQTLGARFRRSPRATFVDQLDRLHAGLEWWPLGETDAPPPAVDGRGLELMPAWIRPLASAECAAGPRLWIHAYDANAQHLAAMSSLPVGLGKPEYRPGPDVQLDPRLPGYWQLAHLPETDPALFNPYRPARPLPRHDEQGRPIEPEIWVTTPTAKLAQDRRELPPILGAWVWPESVRLYRAIYDLLRTGREQHLNATSPASKVTLAVIKSMYKAGPGHWSWRGWEHGHPHHRPYNHHALIGQARVNLYRRVDQLDYKPFAVQVDALYFISTDPDPRTAAPAGLPLGDGLGQYKIKGTCSADVLDGLDLAQLGAVFRTINDAMKQPEAGERE